jgi:hypothetical protein
MAEFVRICPRCGQTNPEYENLCGACNQFIGMEAAVPAPPPTGGQEAAPAGPQHTQATRRYVPVAESFFLQLPESDLLLTVRPGDVLGQAHVSNDAQLQVPASVQGSGFLHRRHCRFERDEGGWRVIAIEQRAHGSGFTNPTFVNQHRLAPGDRHPLGDGDQLRLSGLSFNVRVV